MISKGQTRENREGTLPVGAMQAMSVIWSGKAADPRQAELQERWTKTVYDVVLQRPEKLPRR